MTTIQAPGRRRPVGPPPPDPGRPPVTDVDLRALTGAPALPDDLTHPDDFTEEQREALRLLDETARAHAAGDKPDNTTDAYGQDWEHWRRWCALRGFPLLAVTEGSLMSFAEWLWKEPNPRTGKLTPYSTADRRLSGVVVTARERYRVNLPKEIARLARNRLKVLRDKAEQDEEPPRGRGKAYPFYPEHIAASIESLPETHAGLRDRSVALVSFQIGAREHELAWIRVRDFEFTPKGMLVKVRVSKGGARPKPVAIEYSKTPATCAVRWTLRYFTETGLIDDPDGLAYRRCHNRWQTIMPGHPLSPESIGDIIERTGALVPDAHRVTGHSSRRALALVANENDRDDKWLADRGGWVPGSKAQQGYKDEVDVWKRAGTGDFGL